MKKRITEREIEKIRIEMEDAWGTLLIGGNILHNFVDNI